jgi:hypothetical protein
MMEWAAEQKTPFSCARPGLLRLGGPKEVLMRRRASSLNYRDLMVLEGGGRGPKKLGVVPLPRPCTPP